MVRRLLCMAFCVLALGAAADTITIGSGTLLNQGLPWEPVSNYSYSQQLFLASEIGRAGAITSIGFQYSVASSIFWDGNNAAVVWLGHTSRAALDGWISPDSLQQVFGAPLATEQFSGGVPGSGWLTITLSTPFAYDGSSNLALAVLETAAGHGATNDEFVCTPSTPARSRVLLNPNPIDPQNLPAQTLYSRASHVNLRLEMDVPHHVPYLPQPSDGAQDVPRNTDFAWSSDCTQFDLWLGSAPDSLELVAVGLNASTWHTPEPLAGLSQYWWRVDGHLQSELFSSPVWSFGTTGEDIGPPRNFSAVCVDGVARLSWLPPAIGVAEAYLIFRDGSLLDETTGLSYWDTSVLPGGSYVYYMKCRNALGEVSAPTDPVSVHIPQPVPDLILEQGFEDLTPFGEDIPGWTVLDVDGNPTWAWDITDFPTEGSPHGWMVFCPAQADPPLLSVTPHSGLQMLMSPDAVIAPDDNWLISPGVFLGVSPRLKFWARSATAEYGLERLQVLISAGSLLPEDFTRLHSPAYISVPTAWTQYDFDLAQWQNTHARLALRAVSVSALALFVDDIQITGSGGSVPVADGVESATAPRVYPNPCSGSFRIAGLRAGSELCLYDIRGRKIFSARGISDFSSAAAGLHLPSGIYFLRVGDGKGVRVLRVAVVK